MLKGAKMLIRVAALADAVSIAHVHVSGWHAAYAGIVSQAYLDGLDENQFAGRWQNAIATEPSASIFVAEVDGEICGFACGGPIRNAVSSYDGEL
jgi:hypothetical protein